MEKFLACFESNFILLRNEILSSMAWKNLRLSYSLLLNSIFNKQKTNVLLLSILLFSQQIFSTFPLSAEESDFLKDLEIRGGVLKHDIVNGLHHSHERGYDINGELLFQPLNNEIFSFLFSPHPHIGASLNTKGGSHQFYGGLTWHFDIIDPLFIEVSFGGDINTGRRKIRTRRKKALGARIMFRESISLGIALSKNHNISVMLDHTSNASLASPNPGLTALGVRYGYKL